MGFKITKQWGWILSLLMLAVGGVTYAFDYHDWGVTFLVLGGVMLLEVYIGLKLKWHARITFDVLSELRTIDHAKDTVRNIYANLGIVAALLLTILFAMLLLPEVGLEGQDHDPTVVHLFAAFTGMGALLCLRGVMEAIINIIYTEALTDAGVVRYLIGFPGSIGGPVITISISTLCMVVASAIWIQLNFSTASAVGFGAVAFNFLLFLRTLIDRKSSFTLDTSQSGAKRWKWAQDGGEPPSAMYSLAQVDLIREKGLLAKAHEEAETIRANTKEMHAMGSSGPPKDGLTQVHPIMEDDDADAGNFM